MPAFGSIFHLFGRLSTASVDILIPHQEVLRTFGMEAVEAVSPLPTLLFPCSLHFSYTSTSPIGVPLQKVNSNTTLNRIGTRLQENALEGETSWFQEVEFSHAASFCESVWQYTRTPLTWIGLVLRVNLSIILHN
jgi:hypothetical protein